MKSFASCIMGAGTGRQATQALSCGDFHKLPVQPFSPMTLAGSKHLGPSLHVKAREEFLSIKMPGGWEME